MTTDAVGGVWTYALELARALAERDVQVTLAVLGPAPSDAQRSAWPDLREIPGRLEWEEDPWDDVERAGHALLELEAELRPDVIHSNGYAHGALPWRAPVLVAGHSCVLSWWEAVRGGPAPGAWGRYRDEVRAGLDAAGAVVAPTHAMLDALRRHYGLAADRGRAIANGVRDRRPGVPEKSPFVLGAGRLWDEAKGLATLDAAAAGLSWPVKVAGAGGGRGAAAAERLGQLDPEAMAGAMASAAIFAHPARYEPFGLAPLEAGLAGCALVLGDLPSLREVWGDAAAYVPPGDAAALRAALEGLIADPLRRDALAERALRRARTYGPRRMAAAYAAEYERMHSRRALPA